MRQSLCKIFCCLMVLCCIFSVWVPSASAYTLGDINGDNAINASDALLDLQHSVALIFLTAEQAKAGDVNQDYVVNASDALLILQYSVGLIHNFQFGAITSSADSLSLRPGGCAVVDIKSSDKGLSCYYDSNYIRVFWIEEALSDGSWPLAISALDVSGNISTSVIICYEEDETTYIEIDINITSSASSFYYNNSLVPDLGVLAQTAPAYVGSSDDYGFRSFYYAYLSYELNQNNNASLISNYDELLVQNGFQHDISASNSDKLHYVKAYGGKFCTVILGVNTTDDGTEFVTIYYSFHILSAT